MSKRRKKRKSSKAKRWGIIFAVELILILILIPVVFVYATAAVIARSALLQPFQKRGEIKKMQNRRKASRRRTCVRQRRFSAVEKADNHSFGEIR